MSIPISSCPRCKHTYQTRRRLPFFLRPLRVVGLYVRAYECAMCGRRSLRWR